MVNISPQNVVDNNGNVSAVLLNKPDYEKLNEYIEDLEDSVELSKAIKDSTGFQLWEEFLKVYNSRNK
ncbi:MAG: hypothetical protein A2X61_07100 [Ignavibacteria bacterium GWB2_35_12]|nr:MAG: hypothetical protein A2X63_06220 [Ignavibacteria bacterium GWA2_35_8]OGU39244.1 MAG: hypothetical protein A2X61_07100 [Ignavibacteria bacterium GWB2_35_12]OGU88683.1 MAG: hypothetical protein A2220_00510 [Ignavibacteria bacterium RIFOXYA2_FULL_35_10]OGV23255.1 MAG: hypothetical protein A2475_13455 [Ignavibacteria bacterium RIFOXYC2_FULL_35_21]